MNTVRFSRDNFIVSIIVAGLYVSNRRAPLYGVPLGLLCFAAGTPMRMTVTIPLCVLLFCGSAGAQDLLATNKAVEREIRVGESHSYTVALAAGDYAAGSIDQQGVTVLAAVFRPDGSRMRGLSGPREGKRTFAFIAETAGTYRLELRGPTEAEVSQYGLALDARGKYTLQIDAPLSLEERLKPVPRTDKHVSPAIEALRKQLAHGGTTRTRSGRRRSGRAPRSSSRSKTTVNARWSPFSGAAPPTRATSPCSGPSGAGRSRIPRWRRSKAAMCGT